MKIEYFYILILTLAACLNAIEVTSQIKNNDEGGNATYTVKDLNEIKQITIVGRSADLEIVGTKNDFISIKAEYDYSGMNILNDIIKKIESSDKSVFNSIFIVNDKRDSIEKNEKKDTYFFDFSGSEKERKNYSPLEISKDLKIVDIKLNSGFTDKVIIELPRDLSFNIQLSSGYVEVRDVEAEFTLNSTNIDVEIENCKGVANVFSKVGDTDIKSFDGILNFQNSFGVLKIDRFIGTSSIKKTAGDVKISEFSGNIKSKSQSGLFEMKNSTKVDADIEVRIGEILIDRLTNSKAVDLRVKGGDISITDSEINRLSVYNHGGETQITNTKSDFDIDAVGDVILNNIDLLLSRDNYIKSNFGDISLRINSSDKYLYSELNDEEEQTLKRDEVLNQNIKLRKRGAKNFLYINAENGEIIFK
ncbi:MAG: hypothetical protein JXR48_02475 [Candidatus Delongbacteria bacterium]|nr:hypothetical protein [Candidatus Delongbacteria bacterium]MBN2833812.1 hypothetical protein [Candidatus Delongbacteria bacterium]